MFYKANNEGYRRLLPGIAIKTLVHGANTLCTEFRLEANTVLPKHAHIYEQTGYLIEGRMRLNIGNHSFDVGPGDSWCIPGNIEHSAHTLEFSVAIEVFSPVREDYR